MQGIALKYIKNYLAYYEIHVDDRTFIEHFIIEAYNRKEALAKFSKIESERGPHYHRQIKGFLGIATRRAVHRYLTHKPKIKSLSAEINQIDKVKEDKVFIKRHILDGKIIRGDAK